MSRFDREALSRRRFLKLTMGGVGTLVVACGPAAPEAAPAKPAAPAPTTPPAPAKAAAPAAAKPEMASFSLGMNNPNYATQLVHVVSAEKGFVKEAGFDNIEIITGDEYLPGLVGGSLLATQGDTDVYFQANSKGEPVLFTCCYRSKEWRILGVGKGIETAEDLKGKQLSGGPPGGRNTFIMKKVVKGLGLDPEKDVEWVAVRGASDGRLQAIVAGQIAGGSLFPRHEQALKEAGGKFLVKDFVEMPQEALGVKAETAQKYPGLLTAYLTANLRARQWLFEDGGKKNKDEALAIMEKNGFRITQAFKDTYLDVELLQISPDGGYEVKAMDELVEEVVATGALPKEFDWKKAVDLTFLHNAQKAVGLPIRPAL